MENIEITKQEAFIQFIGKYGENCHCLELLRFFGTYPYARFNRLAVIHAINENGRKWELERALVHLIDEGVVKTCTENNTRLYSLTEDESIRAKVLELAKLDWHQYLANLWKPASQMLYD
jgi:hypothetical protein